MNQISIFDFIDDCLTDDERIFRDVIERGSNISGSLKRIAENVHEPNFTEFIKNEFGIGGRSYSGHHELWDSKGLRCGVDLKRMRLYSWKTVAEAFAKKYGG